MTDLSQLNTPALLLEKQKLDQNITRMAEQCARLDVPLRPHVKTHKSMDVLKRIERGGQTQGITVSTMREAEYFFEAGVSDILYAVGMTPNKIAPAAKLIKAGCELTVIVDNIDMVALLDKGAAEAGVVLNALIELDVDGHRSGINPKGHDLLRLAAALSVSRHFKLRGVMTHAGESYNCETLAQIERLAEEERSLAVFAAEQIRAMGIDCETVSVGSTPTGLLAKDLTGVTELRCGVYTFFDLVQVGLGVAKIDEIAISVLATVIGHQPEKGWVIVDAGWMAMSGDRGTENQEVDQGYGVVCDVSGAPIADIIMSGANQEHGIVSARPGRPQISVQDFPVGSQVRVLPNHACATAAQYQGYDVLEDSQPVSYWRKTGNW